MSTAASPAGTDYKRSLSYLPARMEAAEGWYGELLQYILFALLSLSGFTIAVLAYRGSELDAYESATRQLAQRRLRQVVRSSPEGLVTFITGANSGIGLELAETLARCGVQVALGCRSRSRGTKALVRVKKCADEGGAPQPILILIDVSSPVSVAAAAKEVEQRLKRVDLLYLNAGIMPTSHVRTSTFFQSAVNGQLSYFLETGRSSRESEHTLPQPLDAHDRSPATAGAPFLFSTHVLGHLFLTELLMSSGVLKRGRVPVVDSAGIDDSDHDKGQPSRRELLEAAGAPWPFDGRTREGKALWLGDEDLAGGGGARVIWTSSRAATRQHRDWAALAAGETTVAGEASKGDKSRAAYPRHSESYGEAKYVVDMLNVELDRRLREQSRGAQGGQTREVRSLTMCPGFVATELTPWFMKMAALIEPVIRPYLSGFNVKLPRGADALVRLAVLSRAKVRPDVKWVSHRGRLAAALAGDFPREKAEVAMAARVCDEWMQQWRQAAAAAGGRGAAASGSASQGEKSPGRDGAQGGGIDKVDAEFGEGAAGPAAAKGEVAAAGANRRRRPASRRAATAE